MYWKESNKTFIDKSMSFKVAIRPLFATNNKIITFQNNVIRSKKEKKQFSWNNNPHLKKNKLC